MSGPVARAGRVVLGLALLAGLYVGVAWAVRALHLPVPSNLVALFVLLGLLSARVLPAFVRASVEAAADLLLKHLSLLFVPAAVAVVRYASLVQSHLGDVTLVLVVTTFVVLIVTGRVAEWLLARDDPRESPAGSDGDGRT